MLCLFKEENNGMRCECCGYYLSGISGRVSRNCSGQCGEYPTTLQMASNFLSAVKDFVFSGGKLVDKQEQERRLNICKSCPLNLYVEKDGRCLECGCSMNLKVRAESWHCPKDFW